MDPDIERVLISESAVANRVASLADEVAASYAHGTDGVTLVTVLTGSLIFVADLMRRLPMKTRIGLVGVSSYSGTKAVSTGPVLHSASLPELADRDVLIVDDIIDTGATLRLVQDNVRRARARSLRTAVLLRKLGKAPFDVAVDFVGFDIEDAFVVGYGLDYNGWYRNLPCIAVLRPEAYDG